MSKKLSLARAALIAALAIPTAAVVLPAAAPLSATQAKAGILAEHKQTLAQYGTFVEHAKYGEVWVPTVTPQGWHPYPACNWIYTKYGWYFDDKTAWGQIVHHYGRWSHDEKLGWVWVAGEEFSPGWVVWKTNDQWVGWAPMLPEQDLTTVSAEEFNNDKLWTFMEAAKFGKACGGVVSAQQVPMILTKTKFVKQMVFVDGIMVFVLPPIFVGPIVHISINFNPWSPWFIANIVNFWNIVWNINVNVNIACAAPPPAAGPQKAAAPPAPPANDKPQGKPEGKPEGKPQGEPPIRDAGGPTIRPLPFPVVDPVRPIRPIKPDLGDDKPSRPGKDDTRPGGRPGGSAGNGGPVVSDPCRLVGRCGGSKPIDPNFGQGGKTKPIVQRPIERPVFEKPQVQVQPARPIVRPQVMRPMGGYGGNASATLQRPMGGGMRPVLR
jgi:hypothetical protein